MERLKHLRWSSIKTPSAMALAFLLVSVSPALSDSPLERATLAGLTGVGVRVEPMDPDAEKDGLTTSTLQTDVELKLRQAGIRVLTATEMFGVPGYPYLYLRVATGKVDELGVLAYEIELHLIQEVRLPRNPAITSWAATWRATGKIGTIGSRQLPSVREYVRDIVDQFINAYLAANPKR
jgi:hypothetical protein